MGAEARDLERKFPDGIANQQIRITISGATHRPGAPKGVSYRETPKRQLILELDARQTSYDVASIENSVVALLNDVQGALARERGEDGV